MKAVAICPTYKRPELLKRSIDMFLAQTYPDKHMVIFDDAPGAQLRVNENNKSLPHNVRQYFRTERCEMLPKKFNEIVQQFAIPELKLTTDDVLFVWEDDDVYMQNHMAVCIDAMRIEAKRFAKPSIVLSDYTHSLEQESAAGRFHASMAFTVGAYSSVGGWEETPRADFDQRMIQRLMLGVGEPADPIKYSPPSYIFSWHTGHYHGQHTMKSPDDTTWYEALA